jgi:hypothetical protein
VSVVLKEERQWLVQLDAGTEAETEGPRGNQSEFVRNAQWPAPLEVRGTLALRGRKESAGTLGSGVLDVGRHWKATLGSVAPSVR